MSETPWTPGPWQTAATADDLIVKGRVKIASTYPVDGDVWGAANARLIAAAPDMAEALDSVDRMLSEPRKYNAHTVKAQVRAALAKARGAA